MTGLAQAHSAAKTLNAKPIDLIVCSPLIRALKTAAIISEEIRRPIRVDSELKEQSFGSFEGLVLNDLKRSLGLGPHQRLTGHLPPDAEQSPETYSRAIAVLSRWLAKFAGRKLLFVAHAGLFDSLHELMFGSRLEPNHEPYVFEPCKGSWKVRQVVG